MGARTILAIAFALLASDCSSSGPSCTLSGTGTATITSVDVTSSWLSVPVSGSCTAGADVNTALGERQATIKGAAFELLVRLQASDTGTGTRTAGGFNLAAGTAGIALHLDNDAGATAEYDNVDGVGSVTITSNGGSKGDTLAGTFDGIKLTQSACSVASCPGAPTPIVVSGTFSAQY